MQRNFKKANINTSHAARQPGRRALFPSRIFNFLFFSGWSFCRLFLLLRDKDSFCFISSGLHPCCFYGCLFFFQYCCIVQVWLEHISRKKIPSFLVYWKGVFQKKFSVRLLSTFVAYRWKHWRKEISELKYFIHWTEKYWNEISYNGAMISRVSISPLLECEGSVNILSHPTNKQPHFLPLIKYKGKSKERSFSIRSILRYLWGSLFFLLRKIM